MHTSTNSSRQKRKRAYLSSPLSRAPNLNANLNVDGAGPEALNQATQEGACVDTQPDCHNYAEWSGRGRSPFKIPATAAIDCLRGKARLLEALEREISLRQDQLENLVTVKRARLTGIYESISDISQGERSWANMPISIEQNIGGTPFSKAPVLPPRPNSTNRSLSPAKYLAKLTEGIPAIRHRTFESLTKKGDVPQQVQQVKKQLQDNLGIGCMPQQFKKHMETLQPAVDFEEYAEGQAFGNMEGYSPEYITLLWQKAKSIYDEASFCAERKCDENAWNTDVVLPALKWEQHQTPEMPSFSRPVNVQTQQIDKSCLQISEEPSPSKKADFALSFSSLHPKVEKEYMAIKTGDGKGRQLSQMNDVYTSTIALYLGAEVKKFGGDEVTAQGQCFQWLGAGIKKLRTLIDDVEDVPPLLGWVIVGHKWDLYLALGKGNTAADEIVIYGPVRSCTAETHNYFGALKLLRLVERVKEWAQNEYWPWYCKNVIEPMKTGSDVGEMETEG